MSTVSILAEDQEAAAAVARAQAPLSVMGQPDFDTALSQLLEMGFERQAAAASLRRGCSREAALQELLDGPSASVPPDLSPPSALPHRQTVAGDASGGAHVNGCAAERASQMAEMPRMPHLYYTVCPRCQQACHFSLPKSGTGTKLSVQCSTCKKPFATQVQVSDGTVHDPLHG